MILIIFILSLYHAWVAIEICVDAFNFTQDDAEQLFKENPDKNIGQLIILKLYWCYKRPIDRTASLIHKIRENIK